MVVDLFQMIDDFIWGPPLLILLVGTGIYLTFVLRGIQFNQLFHSLRLVFKNETDSDGDISSFAALCTALAGTVGTGNIVGVATAIAIGGPGALFWMWFAALFGMATKYSEGLLAVKFRVKDEQQHVSGGPMYYILNGMGQKYRPLATMFAFSGILVALFGIGTFTQVNAITEALHNQFAIPNLLTGFILALLVMLIVFGGITIISKVASFIVPFMALLYIVACLFIIIANWQLLDDSLLLIIQSAFTKTAATGGFVGSTMKAAIQNGIARGVFSNESGLGSSPIASAAAKSNSAVEQGLVSMTGTFIDTIIICTLTGIVLIITGAWQTEFRGALMTQYAFNAYFSEYGPFILTISLSLFAFTTILGWNYYGERCFEFLFGLKYIRYYHLFFVSMVFIGSFLNLDLVWIIADIVNGLMAIPNLISLIALSPIIIKETRAYFKAKQYNNETRLEPIKYY
ncbi:MAG TPA: sodium:alanine symporter family protein [Globicatella sulfidifaciens]|uniref:Sodium:alanine symporter family protein n=1 Tax=Globicatella sulfidifaciens TaxID=136093 RepID=A0A7X8C2J0_9LACT|nr:sodium:alanine symporter family protein [Globicatella sulfidifaciens]NLJ17677.1 sodium:alanine symporter family protein [Globicatella sulfidifaciens]HJF16243.1 sodium:alanine symporter family protein [Globicatella sulfidifaciens]